jgi:hypothetical protein
MRIKIVADLDSVASEAARFIAGEARGQSKTTALF